MPDLVAPFLSHLAFAGLLAAQFSAVVVARRLLQI
jgi:hypothetical protein